MSVYDNNFIKKLSKLPFVAPFLLTHEDPVELIQGGSPGEHYHMTEAEHDAVQSLGALGIYEPMYINFEPVFDSDGDIMMGRAGV